MTDSSVQRIPGLPADTETVFRIFAAQPSLAEFVLIGGTAMALQCQHRLSEDLDFWLPQGTLSDRAIRPALEAAKQQGLQYAFTTPHDQISTFRINKGMKLENFARDYAVGGVKVQFFAPDAEEYESFIPYLASCQRHTGAGTGRVNTAFRIMPMAGLFAMKSHVIQQRNRSRDVFDLWYFVRAGRGVAEIIESAQQASTTATAHRAFAVLRGDLPLDAMDEGFKSLAPEIDMTKVYADFRVWTDAYEQDIAHAIKVRSAP